MLTGLFIGLSLLILAIIVALINMGRMVNNTMNLDASGVETSFRLHLASMGVGFFGTLMSVVCGAGYLVQTFAH